LPTIVYVIATVATAWMILGVIAWLVEFVVECVVDWFN